MQGRSPACLSHPLRRAIFARLPWLRQAARPGAGRGSLMPPRTGQRGRQDRARAGGAGRLLLSYGPALLWSLVLAGVAGATALPATPQVRHFDKLAHFGAYAVLGALLGWGWLRAGRRPALGWLLAFALLLGASDEYRHSRMPERSGELGDWVADALGAAAGLYLAVRLGRRRYGTNDRDNG
jgi:VanZ family protein